MKEPLFSNRLLRPFLPLVSVCVLMLFCTGCCTERTLKKVGTVSNSLTDYQWELSPDKSEIAASGKLKTAYHYLPFYDFHELPAWTTSEPYEKRFPLDPFPDSLVRFYLKAEPDANVQRAARYAVPDMGGAANFWTPAEHMTGDDDSTEDTRSIRDGETLVLRVHPEDMPVLSEPFFLMKVRPRHPGYEGFYLVIPYAHDGDCYTMLACRTPEPGYRNALDPFDDEARRIPWTEKAGPFGWCFRILAIPPALVADTLCLPVYLWIMIVELCGGFD